MPLTISALSREKPVAKALTSFSQSFKHGVGLAIEIQQIPAPTFAEHERAKHVLGKFIDIGLDDARLDDLYNVFGRFPGQRSSLPPVVISAHTDTVFPLGTDIAFKQAGNRIFGPGMADNSMGVAGLLWLAETLKSHSLNLDRDLWFVANVGEEGLGDLCGMRAIVNHFGEEATYIILEGGSFGHVIHKGIGVKRYDVVVKAIGGHSWADFGQSSAIHTLSHIVSQIDRIAVPAVPKTTFNIGVIDGGTSINTIAEKANFLLDLRSESPVELDRLMANVKVIFKRFDQMAHIQVTASKIGDRPVGEISRDSTLVRWAADALKVVGCRKIEFGASSTDANIPLSIGADAVCIGIGESGNVHRQNEFLDITNVTRGMSQLLLLTVMAANAFDPA